MFAFVEDILKDMFKKRDLDGDGKLNIKDVEELLAEIKQQYAEYKEERLKKIRDSYLQQFDKDLDNFISVEEFISSPNGAKLSRLQQEAMKLMFKKVDLNNDGVLDTKEIDEMTKGFIEELKDDYEPENLKTFFQKFDLKKVKKISLDEFINAIKN